MPLVVTVCAFLILFSCEGLWFDNRRIRREMQLTRYQQVEHPTGSRSDRYIDVLA